MEVADMEGSIQVTKQVSA